MSVHIASPARMGLLASMSIAFVLAACLPAAAPGDSETDGGSTPEAAAESTASVSPTPEVATADMALPGNCWEGALPEGMHCYVLEQAQMDGAVKVSAVFEAPNKVLHIFFERSEPLDAELSVLFREKAAEYLEAGDFNESDIEFGWEVRSSWYRWRPSLVEWGSTLVEELVGKLDPPGVQGYEQGFLYRGGREAVTSIPSWASWTQLWPEESVVPDVFSGAGFDVSGVDIRNIPDPECDPGPRSLVCEMWNDHPETGIAGFHRDSDRRPGAKKWRAAMQIKGTLIPEGEGEREALKQKLLPGYDEFPYSLEIELVPVKYDYGQLWRWATILDRFAVSSGNTIGILGGRVSTNRYGIGDKVFPLDSLELADALDSSTVRDTVAIDALDAGLVAEALPELLPLLGIPVDAVGVIRTIYQGYQEFVPE